MHIKIYKNVVIPRYRVTMKYVQGNNSSKEDLIILPYFYVVFFSGILRILWFKNLCFLTALKFCLIENVYIIFAKVCLLSSQDCNFLAKYTHFQFVC